MEDVEEGAAFEPTFSLVVSVKLPCGCTLQMSMRQEGANNDIDRVAKTTILGAGKLATWLKLRAPRHDCSLVGPDNPNGITPRATAVEG